MKFKNVSKKLRAKDCRYVILHFNLAIKFSAKKLNFSKAQNYYYKKQQRYRMFVVVLHRENDFHYLILPDLFFVRNFKLQSLLYRCFKKIQIRENCLFLVIWRSASLIHVLPRYNLSLLLRHHLSGARFDVFFMSSLYLKNAWKKIEITWNKHGCVTSIPKASALGQGHSTMLLKFCVHFITFLFMDRFGNNMVKMFS